MITHPDTPEHLHRFKSDHLLEQVIPVVALVVLVLETETTLISYPSGRWLCEPQCPGRCERMNGIKVLRVMEHGDRFTGVNISIALPVGRGVGIELRRGGTRCHGSHFDTLGSAL